VAAGTITVVSRTTPVPGILPDNTIYLIGEVHHRCAEGRHGALEREKGED
jgi:hypothetical protein